MVEYIKMTQTLGASDYALLEFLILTKMFGKNIKQKLWILER